MFALLLPALLLLRSQPSAATPAPAPYAFPNSTHPDANSTNPSFNTTSSPYSDWTNPTTNVTDRFNATSNPYNLTNPLNSTTPPSNTTILPLAIPIPHLQPTYPYPNAIIPSLHTTCTTYYPTSLLILNSLYPFYISLPLHSTRRFFMILRQLHSVFSVATQVQFSGLPPASANTTCRLELALPAAGYQHIGGDPVLDVWSVQREAGAGASWASFVGSRGSDTSASDVSVSDATENGTAVLFGAVSGEERALTASRVFGSGVVVVGERACNETLTFQMGLRDNGGVVVQYWDFVNLAPPAGPVQGWRVVVGC